MNKFTKKITINGTEHEIEIAPPTLGELYMFRVVGVTAFTSLPNECLKDMDKFKELIIKSIKDRYGDLSSIHEWDGVVEAKELTYLIKNVYGEVFTAQVGKTYSGVFIDDEEGDSLVSGVLRDIIGEVAYLAYLEKDSGIGYPVNVNTLRPIEYTEKHGENI